VPGTSKKKSQRVASDDDLEQFQKEEAERLKRQLSFVRQLQSCKTHLLLQ
jgi:hypothetical protein